jgi:hypothetical protein
MNSVLNPGSAGKPVCWGCGEAVDPQDSYCRHCGKGQGERVPWQYSHWGIIVLTLAALGPFSLYYLWRSPAISPQAKWGYTAAILLLTAFIANRFYKLWQVYQAVLGGGLPF